MAEKIFPRFQQLTDVIDLTSADIEKLNDEARVFFEREVSETDAFLAAHPEYHACDENAKLLEAWMYLHGDLPFTLWNLEIALRDLQEDGLLKQATPPEQPAVDKSRGIIEARSDALMEYQTPSDEQAALNKLKDDPSLSDTARKSRDRKLALLTGQQRRELAAH